MNTFCAATGLKIFSRPEWTNKKISDTCANSFSISGNNILYSAPVGHFDLKGIQNSIQLKNEVKRYISEGDGPYIQILDYAALKGSTLAVRKLFIKDLNDDKRLQAVIFCNISLLLSTAAKIGKQFITTGKRMYIVKHYVDAIKLALKLCDQYNLKQDFHTLDQSFCIDSSIYSQSQVLLNSDKDWDIHVPGFSSRATIIDRGILHSVSEGYLKNEHLPLIGQLRNKCQMSLPQDYTLKYMVVGLSGLDGMSHKSRLNLMASLKEWHERFPFRMYIIYGADTFAKTAAYLARSIMPFKVKIAQDFNHALEIIRRDKPGGSGKEQKKQKGEGSIELTSEDLEKLLALVASLNWEETGVDSSCMVEEHHPFYMFFQSIKLIKDEFDSLLNEQKILTESLQAQKLFLKKQATQLEESNITLKVLLKQGGEDKKEIEKKVLHNIEHLVFPYIDKLKTRMSTSDEMVYVEIIESNLKEIISPFVTSLSSNQLKLTPAEIQVADMVRQGKSTKEIANLLKLSPTTIATHRQNIRKKLALTNKKMNLRSILTTSH